MTTTKVNEQHVVRAFEVWSDGSKKTFYAVTCEATTKGTPIQGSPFTVYKTHNRSIGNKWLRRILKMSREIEAGERAESKANLTIKANSADIEASAMKFAVEAAAIKFMRRLMHSDMGGKDEWIPTYEGMFTIENLEGRETVSPFNKDLAEAESASPKAFTVSDDDFRERRMRRRRMKKRKAAMEAELGEGECLVRAYHPATGALVAGMNLVGYRTNVIGQLLSEDGRVVSDEARAEGWSVQTFPGWAVTDSNLFTTVKTTIDASKYHVTWRIPAGGEFAEYEGINDDYKKKSYVGTTDLTVEMRMTEHDIIGKSEPIE